ncbi:MAG: DUF4126 domain-containing protein [Planctomycetaceae bacterium]|nr:DUF4126 domain-containing protein [Planctomycetaceae bacterium]
MQSEAVIYVVGATGSFPTRGFLTAFLTALLFRFGHSIPLISSSGILQAGEGVPEWFTHQITLWLLGGLSILEIWATKDPNIKDLLDQFDGKIKTVVSFLVSYGVLSATDGDLIHATAGVHGGAAAIATGCAGGVFALSNIRSEFYDVLGQMDPDDSLGLRRILSWIEDFWVVGAFFLLILFPLIVLFLSGLIFLSLYLVRKHLERMDDAAKVACPGCASRIYPSAVICHDCKRTVQRPCAVGFFSQMKPTVPANMAVHCFQLIERSRCPACASRLQSDQDCPACGLRLCDDRNLIDAYIQFIDRRRRTVLPVCFALSLLPVLGAVPAIVYYRLALVAPYQRHIPRGRRIVTRWTLRLINFGLLAFQWIPVLGGFMLPLMAMTSHWAYRSAFQSRFEGDRTNRMVPARAETTRRKLT